MKLIFVLGALAILAAGCCDRGSGVRSIVDHNQWTVLSDSDDPFISRKPAEAPCVPDSIGYEDFAAEASFTVKSQGCTYVTVAQPCLSGACPGEQLHLRLWHYNLTNITGAAEAYAAIALDGKTVWEETIPIPGPSGLIRPYLPIDTELAEGTRIEFHLQNHGQNSWNLIELSVGGEPPEEE